MASVQSFGEFLRAKRKASGMTLREFCRQHQFDPGNVSRLERGKAKPPQSPVVLEELAKALGLSPGSAEWGVFMDLAAVEAGRVPSEVVNSRSRAKMLTDTLGVLRRERRRHGTWVSAHDLESWADFLDARSQLPLLIRRLVRATTDVSSLQFPADEGIQRPGWDGVIEAKNGSAYVPTGTSAWELGTDSKFARKAEQDYLKRTNNPLGLVPSESTFVFVTPRKWERKNEWCQEKIKSGVWRDVRVYDSANIQEWLEIAPAVDAWFARMLGRKPESVIDLEEHWEGLSEIATPSLKPEVFLASRKEEVKWLEDWLSGPPSSLAVEARSPAEVLDFFAAYAMSSSDGLDEGTRDSAVQLKQLALGRTLIVGREDAWHSLCSDFGNLILVPKPGLQLETEAVAKAVKNGHRVLLASHRFSNVRISKQTLPRSFRHDIEKALTASGFGEAEASRAARESGGSLTILKRRLAQHHDTKIPVWAEGDNAAELAPFILVGAWDDSRSADRKVVDAITAYDDAQVRKLVNRWAHSDDPPLMQILSQCSLMSHEDAWVMLGSHVTRSQLDSFEKVVLEVLGEHDSNIELSDSERVLAAFQGQSISVSRALRTGLAETLGMLGSWPDYISHHGTALAERVVRQLLHGQDWKRWASLTNELPILAEAAPTAFLDAVKFDLASEDSQLGRLLQDRDESPLPSCMHAGLLWALEGLAWSGEYLWEVTRILGRLHDLDTGTRWSNRPMGSLVEIYLPWLPKTTVGVQHRVRILERFVRNNENVGWQLLMRLLPERFEASTPTHQPKWRSWVMDWQRGVKIAEYQEQVHACAGLLLELAGTNALRWTSLIENCDNFPESRRQDLLLGLSRLNKNDFDVDGQRQITDAIRAKVLQHQRHASEEWALPSDAVERLEAAASYFEPQDAIAKNLWLFAPWPSVLLYRSESSTEERARELQAMRRKALGEVLESGGMERVLELAQVSEAPFCVGVELVGLEKDKHDSLVLPKLIDSSDEALAQLAKGYVQARFFVDKWDLPRQLRSEVWTPQQIVAFGLALRQDRETWEWIESHESEVVANYWRKCDIFFDARKSSDLHYAITMLLRFGRPFSAIKVLAMSLYSDPNIDSELLLKALEGGVSLQDDCHDSIRPASHDIQKLFDTLQKRSSDVDQTRLAQMEWAYLDVLNGHGAYPATLHMLLSSDPNFFVDVLHTVYPSENASDDQDAERTDKDRDRAMQAYKLLMTWESVPGSSADGKSVDREKLQTWVTDARTIAQASGYLRVCDRHIGEVFAYSPDEVDGSWPCIAVRDAMGSIGTDELRKGFVREAINKRGVYMKSPYDGGGQERALAARYSQNADICQYQWPYVSEALRELARYYENEAQREDADVEANK